MSACKLYIRLHWKEGADLHIPILSTQNYWSDGYCKLVEYISIDDY